MSILPLSFNFEIKIIKLVDDSDFFCPIFLKGNDNFVDKKYDRFPGLFLNEKTG